MQFRFIGRQIESQMSSKRNPIFVITDAIRVDYENYLSGKITLKQVAENHGIKYSRMAHIGGRIMQEKMANSCFVKNNQNQNP